MVRNITIWSYLEPFLKTNEPLHLADISKQLNEPHPTVRNYLNYFEKKGILIKKNKGRLTLYQINLESQNLINYLVIAEKEKLIRKTDKDLILNEIVAFLNKKLSNQKALIFGSATKSLKKANDVDLLIVGKINFEDELEELSKRLNVKLHLLNPLNLKSISETLKKEIIKKHLIINASEEVIRWLI